MASVLTRPSPSCAAEIADEQIAYWQAIGVSADDVWRGMGLRWAWAVEWREVRAMLIRYLLGTLDGAEPARLAA